VTWVKLSDDFAEKAARSGLSDAAFRTHIEALLWTMRRETGGWIRARDIPRFAETKDPEAAVIDLVSAGWWHHPAGDDRYPHDDPDYDPGADPDLFRIVANMDDQPEPEVIEARRRKTAERVRKLRRRQAGLPEDEPCNAVTERVAGPVTERVTRDGTGRGLTSPPVPYLVQDQCQDQWRPRLVAARRGSGGTTPAPAGVQATPLQSLRDHNGSEPDGPDVQQISNRGTSRDQPADRNAREAACPVCGLTQKLRTNGKLARHGPKFTPCRGSGLALTGATP
jgi:hypothetical protein